MNCSFSEMEVVTGARMGDFEDLKIWVNFIWEGGTESALSRRSSVNFRPVQRRAMRSSQNIPRRIRTIGETSMVVFSVNARHHFRNTD
jgi:hypothetical protein